MFGSSRPATWWVTLKEHHYVAFSLDQWNVRDNADAMQAITGNKYLIGIIVHSTLLMQRCNGSASIISLMNSHEKYQMLHY